MDMTTTSRVREILKLTDAEVQNLVSVLGDIGEDGRNAFCLNLTDNEWAAIPNIKEAVAYQGSTSAQLPKKKKEKIGFDPHKVAAEFLRRAAINPAEDDDPVSSVTVGPTTISVHQKSHARTDLLFLITLFLMRGNNVAKILLKCDSAERDVISRKCSQYGIDTTARKRSGPLGQSVITLARLSQAFSPATAVIILSHSIVGNLKAKLFPGVELPILMTHTIFPGLLRLEDVELIEIARYLNLEMSIMLSSPKDKRKMEGTTLSDLLEQSETFVMAAVNGSLITDGVKVKTLKKAGIMMPDGSLSTTVLAMHAFCNRLHGYRSEAYSVVVRKVTSQVNK